MELYDSVIKIIDINLVYSLIPMILTLISIAFFYRNRFATKKVLNLIRWFIIGYSIITLIHFLIEITILPDTLDFFNRATEPYKTAYWIMILSATVLPFTLLYKKLASNYLYVLLISFAIKTGEYFERFVIITTSFHRDYEPIFDKSNWWNSLTIGISIIWIQGILLAFITLWVYSIIERRGISHNTP